MSTIWTCCGMDGGGDCCLGSGGGGGGVADAVVAVVAVGNVVVAAAVGRNTHVLDLDDLRVGLHPLDLCVGLYHLDAFALGNLAQQMHPVVVGVVSLEN